MRLRDSVWGYILTYGGLLYGAVFFVLSIVIEFAFNLLKVGDDLTLDGVMSAFPHSLTSFKVLLVKILLYYLAGCGVGAIRYRYDKRATATLP